MAVSKPEKIKFYPSKISNLCNEGAYNLCCAVVYSALKSNDIAFINLEENIFIEYLDLDAETILSGSERIQAESKKRKENYREGQKQSIIKGLETQNKIYELLNAGVNIKDISKKLHLSLAHIYKCKKRMEGVTYGRK